MESGKPRLFVLVDGEDMDLALGRILGHKPLPMERPRWGRVLSFARKLWPDHDVRGLFFIRLTHPLSENIQRFIDAMKSAGFKPARAENVKQKIGETLQELAKRKDDVVLLSHQDYTEELTSLVDDQRFVGVVAFPELLGHKDEYEGSKITIIDFERDVKVFEHSLSVRQMYTDEVAAASLLDDQW